MRDYERNIMYELSIKVTEDYDDFIFERINPFCEEVAKTKISKQMLKRALIEYKQNHPEEFEQ